jgi:hypothetical protein
MQMQMLSGHVPTLAAKEAVLEPPPRRDDLVYVHCATTEDEEIAEDEEDEPRGLTRSRSWLCCPGDRRSDKTVPIQVEVDNKDRQNAVSSVLCPPSLPRPIALGAPGREDDGILRDENLPSAYPPPSLPSSRFMYYWAYCGRLSWTSVSFRFNIALLRLLFRCVL